jgi:hypothetical protein
MNVLVGGFMVIYIMVGIWCCLTAIDGKIFNNDMHFCKNCYKYITYLDLIIAFIFLPLFLICILFCFFLMAIDIIPNELSKRNTYKKLTSTIFKEEDK